MLVYQRVPSFSISIFVPRVVSWRSPLQWPATNHFTRSWRCIRGIVVVIYIYDELLLWYIYIVYIINNYYLYYDESLWYIYIYIIQANLFNGGCYMNLPTIQHHPAILGWKTHPHFAEPFCVQEMIMNGIPNWPLGQYCHDSNRRWLGIFHERWEEHCQECIVTIGYHDDWILVMSRRPDVYPGASTWRWGFCKDLLRSWAAVGRVGTTGKLSLLGSSLDPKICS